ncbi:hypothetical protein PINS_up015676 [Pythium insidiosum]|nr:hypothetical protein PINS_up015676 [Pythium insidiosum]
MPCALPHDIFYEQFSFVGRSSVDVSDWLWLPSGEASSEGAALLQEIASNLTTKCERLVLQGLGRGFNVSRAPLERLLVQAPRLIELDLTRLGEITKSDIVAMLRSCASQLQVLRLAHSEFITDSLLQAVVSVLPNLLS